MDKSFVSPFLFDIKRSEVKGPILQFQSTILQKEDIKKLLNTLNKACGETSIPEARLDKAFDVWFPTLEEELNKIKEVTDEPEEGKKVETNKVHNAEILEEILDLSRNNQKLLRSPDSKLQENMETLTKLMHEHVIRADRNMEMEFKRISRKMHPMFIEEIMHITMKNGKSYYGILIALSFFKNEFPWIYDLGRELVDTLKSKVTKDKKIEAVSEFKEMLELSLGHPMMRDLYGTRKDSLIYNKELPYVLNRCLDRLIEE